MVAEHAVRAGLGPKAAAGSKGNAGGRRSFVGEGERRKEHVKEEVKKVRKDLETNLDFNVMGMRGGQVN